MRYIVIKPNTKTKYLNSFNLSKDFEEGMIVVDLDLQQFTSDGITWKSAKEKTLIQKVERKS